MSDDGRVSKITYDMKWIRDNKDYPTLLNNFIYLFGQIDKQWRSNLAVHEKNAGFLEMIAVKGKKDYPNDMIFRYKSGLYALQMKAYSNFLENEGIYLEDIFKWFFEEYISDEFGMNGFLFNAPSRNTTLVEKCKMMVTEIDGVLKQFRMFVEDGKIDRELLEMSSGQIDFGTIRSIKENKYAYAQGNEIKNEATLLFSGQTCLTFWHETDENFDNLAQLIIQKSPKLENFEEYQKSNIQWLIERKSLVFEDERLRLNTPRVAILASLYFHDVVCVSYLSYCMDAFSEMVDNHEIRIEGTLFSEPERDYLNFTLNKSKYSNGRDIRNRYAHSTYPTDPAEQETDYLEILKIMVMILGKITEEGYFLEEKKRDDAAADDVGENVK